MGLRFRRGLGLGRGLRLNISKGGVSLTAGGKGRAINIGRRGVTGTLGLPGSGISYSRRLGKGGIVSWVFVLAVAALIAWQYLGQSK